MPHLNKNHAKLLVDEKNEDIQSIRYSHVNLSAPDKTVRAKIEIRTYLARYFEKEVNFAHDFLWIPNLLILGAFFNFTRQNNIPDLALIVPIIILSVVLVFFGAMRMRTKFGLKLICAFFIGAYAANIEMQKPLHLIDQDLTTTISGYIVSVQRDAKNTPRYVIELKATSEPKIRRPPERVQLVAKSDHEIMQVGQLISGRARLSAPSGPVFPGGHDFAFSAYVKGIGAYGFFLGAPQPVVTSGRYDTKLDLPFSATFEVFVRNVQSHIAGRIQATLSGDAAGIASALIVADKRSISQEVVTELRQAGLAHVLAISGLHMVLAAGTLFLTVRFLFSLFPSLVHSFPVKKIAALGAICAASSYLVISGAPISAQRAWIMLSIILFAVITDRPAITLRNVGIAAIIIVLLSPSAVMTPGFQMSFAAAAALVSVYGSWARRSGVLGVQKPEMVDPNIAVKGIKIVLGLAMTAFIAGIATGIFSAQHFYHIAGYGILGNVLAMPIVTFFVMPLALLSVLLMPYGLEVWPLLALGEAIDVVVVIAHWVSQLDGDFVSGKPNSWAAFLAVIGFIIFVTMRSTLKFIGLSIILIGMIANIIYSLQTPDIFISEDGKLIGLHTSGALHVNRTRPSKFIVEQWQDAFRLDIIKPATNKEAKISKNDKTDLLTLSSELFWQSLEAKPKEPKDAFICFDTHLCTADYRGLKIVTVGKTKYLDLACGYADVLVIALKLRAGQLACKDWPEHIFDGNRLKKTGSVAIYIDQKDKISKITSAVDDRVRPWTIQRYFKWRSSNYQLPNGIEQTYHPSKNELRSYFAHKKRANESAL